MIIMFNHCLKLFISIFFVLCLYFNNVKNEYFTAVVDMIKAVKITQDMVVDLQTYLNIEEKRLNEIRQLVNSIDKNLNFSDSVNSKLASESSMSNPLYAYSTFKKLALSLKHQVMETIYSKMNIITKSNSQARDNTLSSLIHRVEENAGMLPGTQDLNGVTDAILRLQSIYKLSSKNLAKGFITDSITGPPMTGKLIFIYLFVLIIIS